MRLNYDNYRKLKFGPQIKTVTLTDEKDYRNTLIWPLDDEKFPSMKEFKKLKSKGFTVGHSNYWPYDYYPTEINDNASNH